MMLIQCPICGDRNQEEFICGGEAHVARPARPEQVPDSAWNHYLHIRNNSAGLEFERWHHAYGCGRWFNVARNTMTHDIHAVYGIGEPPPESFS